MTSDPQKSDGGQPPQSFRDGLIETIPSLRAFAMSLVNNSAYADDLVQETVTKAWHKWHLFREGTNIKAWLFTILRNELFSQMRKKKPEVDDSEGIHEASLAAAPQQQLAIDITDLQVALDKLPSEQREALILVGASGFSYEEAAEISECAVGTVKSRVNRARVRLAEIMGLDTNDRSEELV